MTNQTNPPVAAPEPPEGWAIVREGRVKDGDKVVPLQGQQWVDARDSVGHPVSYVHAVARKLPANAPTMPASGALAVGEGEDSGRLDPRALYVREFVPDLEREHEFCKVCRWAQIEGETHEHHPRCAVGLTEAREQALREALGEIIREAKLAQGVQCGSDAFARYTILGRHLDKARAALEMP